MSKKIVKLLSLLIAVSFIFTITLAGCGTSNNNNASNTSTAVSTAQSTAQQAETKQNVTLSMWTWKVAYVPGFQAVADEFEKKTGIKVEIESFTPDQTYQQKVQAAANAGNLPDLVHWWSGVPNYDSFMDIQGAFDDTAQSAFYPGSWSTLTVKDADVQAWAASKDANTYQKALKAGQVFGAPVDVGGFFTFYGNKKLIQDAGLQPEAPKTWEQFVDMMKTIKEKTGVPGLVMAAKFPNLWQNWAGFALNAMFTGEDGLHALLNREANMSDPQNLKVLQALEDLSKAGVIYPGSLNLDIDTGDQTFAQGKAAFDLGGSFTLASLIAMGMNPDDFFAFPIPPLEGSKYDKWSLTPFTLTMLSVSKDTKNKDAAIDYIKYFSTPDSALAFANAANTIPAVNLGDNVSKLSPSLASIVSSYSTKGDDPLSKISDVYPSRYYDPEWKVFDNNTQKIIAGEMTAVQAAKEFDDARAKQVAADKQK